MQLVNDLTMKPSKQLCSNIQASISKCKTTKRMNEIIEAAKPEFRERLTVHKKTVTWFRSDAYAEEIKRIRAKK